MCNPLVPRNVVWQILLIFSHSVFLSTFASDDISVTLLKISYQARGRTILEIKRQIANQYKCTPSQLTRNYRFLSPSFPTFLQRRKKVLGAKENESNLHATPPPPPFYSGLTSLITTAAVFKLEQSKTHPPPFGWVSPLSKHVCALWRLPSFVIRKMQLHIKSTRKFKKDSFCYWYRTYKVRGAQWAADSVGPQCKGPDPSYKAVDRKTPSYKTYKWQHFLLNVLSLSFPLPKSFALENRVLNQLIIFTPGMKLMARPCLAQASLILPGRGSKAKPALVSSWREDHQGIPEQTLVSCLRNPTELL